MTFSAHRLESKSELDLTSLSKLIDDYRKFYRQQSNIDAALNFIRDRLSHGDSEIFFAKNQDGVIGGFTQLYPSFSTISLKCLWILNDLFVSPKFRKIGIASILMKAAQDFAEQQDCKGLSLKTEKDNLGAQNLYIKHGWKLDDNFIKYDLIF